MARESLHQNFNLPEEIIADILSRLPVKSLLRFTSISQSWHSLISSKHFIKSHLKNSTKNKTCAHHRILSITKIPNSELQHSSLHSLLFEQITSTELGDFPKVDSFDSLHLLGCCNGLVCILINKESFFLWNPSTRESKKLPVADVRLMTRGYILEEHGFGYDESSDDYKVFAVLSDIYRSTAKTYSLKTNSWRRMNAFEDGEAYFYTGKFVCGNLHWVKTKEASEESYISSFNLKNEVYGIVEQPNDILKDFELQPLLGDYVGCLSLVYYYVDHGFHLWVLKEYGVKDAWSKLLTISDEGFINTVHFHAITFYITSPSGDVLFNYGSGSGVVAYNPKKNSFWGPKKIGFNRFQEYDIYVESLVRIN